MQSCPQLPRGRRTDILCRVWFVSVTSLRRREEAAVLQGLCASCSSRCFASKALSHSHRALARCNAGVIKKPFQRFRWRKSTETVETVSSALHCSCTGLKPGENERTFVGKASSRRVYYMWSTHAECITCSLLHVLPMPGLVEVGTETEAFGVLDQPAISGCVDLDCAI